MNTKTNTSAILACFYQGKLVLIEDECGFHLPRTQPEAGEPVEKSLRRLLYEKTGGLLGKCHELGSIVKDVDGQEHETVLFVGEVQCIERPRLESQAYFCDVNRAFTLLREKLPQETEEELCLIAQDFHQSGVTA